MIFRTATDAILADLAFFPVIAIVGARQVGKTTLAKSIRQYVNKPTLYLDLESEDDLASVIYFFIIPNHSLISALSCYQSKKVVILYFISAIKSNFKMVKPWESQS